MPGNEPSIRRLKQLYRDLGYVSAFVHWRCWHTPYALLEELTPKDGVIIDLGCGYGLFANLLAMTSARREVIGLELSDRKLKYASRGLPNVSFRNTDVLKADWASCRGLALVHLLHHLRSFEEQERLLRRCYDALQPGGVLLMLEVDKTPAWKFLVSQVVDRVAYPLDRFYFRERRAFTELVSGIGFREIKTVLAHRGVPMSHTILTATK